MATVSYTPTIVPSHVQPGWWYVQSSRDPDTLYVVSPEPAYSGSCSCPDFQHRGGPCKHVKAVQVERAELAALFDLTPEEFSRRWRTGEPLTGDPPRPTLSTAAVNRVLFGADAA